MKTKNAQTAVSLCRL